MGLVVIAVVVSLFIYRVAGKNWLLLFFGIVWLAIATTGIVAPHVLIAGDSFYQTRLESWHETRKWIVVLRWPMAIGSLVWCVYWAWQIVVASKA
jgi:hypothetical protein